MTHNPTDIGQPTLPQRDPDEDWMDTMDQVEHTEMSDMSDAGLLAEMQKCASQNPETRKHLVPLIQRALKAATLKCDGEKGCKKPVTYITNKGFLLCDDHRPAKGDRYTRARKLRPGEIKKLEKGETLGKYASHVRMAAEEIRISRQVEAEDMMVMAAHYYGLSEARWEGLTNFEKLAAFRRIAHKPIMTPMGLTKAMVRAGDAFMVYMVNPANNNSKFYEGMIVPNDDGSYSLIRRWGRLTDSGQTGRIDGGKFDRDPRFRFPDIRAARKALQQHLAKRLQKGYVDAFGPKHKTPDGKKLPMGQYPVGLGAAGFGWGGQSVATCSPVLRDLQGSIQEAISRIREGKRSDSIQASCERAKTFLSVLAHEDSTMARKILGELGRVLRRLGGSTRFLPDPEGAALTKELARINTYVGKQLSMCGR